MVQLSRIYTKSGDKGKTSLGDGTRVFKSSLRIEAIGSIDEANSALGVVRLYTSGHEDMILKSIQNDLFDLGADLCMVKETKESPLRITEQHVVRLEREIDEMNEHLPTLNSFILPGGTPASAFLHQARSTARSAERVLVALSEHEHVNTYALHYINRVSDYFFVLARYMNLSVTTDTLWEPGKFAAE